MSRKLSPQAESVLPAPRETRGGRGEPATIAAMGLQVNRSVLERERVRSGLSLTEIAKRIGCDRSYLGHLEKGRKQPSYELLERLAAFWNLPVHDLTVAAGAEQLLAAARG